MWCASSWTLTHYSMVGKLTCNCKVRRCATCGSCSRCGCENDGIPLRKKLGRSAGGLQPARGDKRSLRPRKRRKLLPHAEGDGANMENPPLDPEFSALWVPSNVRNESIVIYDVLY